MEAFWQQLEIKLIDRSVLRDNLGCRIWTGSLRMSGYGRIWVKWPGMATVQEELAHRVAYMAAVRIRDLDCKLEVSHLCHTKSCVRAGHLVMEPHSVNMERSFCKEQAVCTQVHRPECLL
jgi:hypothetical protein